MLVSDRDPFEEMFLGELKRIDGWRLGVNRAALIRLAMRLSEQSRFIGSQLGSLLAPDFRCSDFTQLVFTSFPNEDRYFIVGWFPTFFLNELLNGGLFLLTPFAELLAKFPRDLLNFKTLVGASFVPAIFDFIAELHDFGGENVAVSFGQVGTTFIKSAGIE